MTSWRVIDRETIDALVEQEGVRQMEMGGRTMKGYLLVDPDVLKTQKQMAYRMQLYLDFNPKAKSSKK